MYVPPRPLSDCILIVSVKIDIDCMDPAEARRFLPFKPHDQTSNQRLVYEQMISPENQELFLKTVKEGKEEGWEVILDRMVCYLALYYIRPILDYD